MSQAIVKVNKYGMPCEYAPITGSKEVFTPIKGVTITVENPALVSAMALRQHEFTTYQSIKQAIVVLPTVTTDSQGCAAVAMPQVKNALRQRSAVTEWKEYVQFGAGHYLFSQVPGGLVLYVDNVERVVVKLHKGLYVPNFRIVIQNVAKLRISEYGEAKLGIPATQATAFAINESAAFGAEAEVTVDNTTSSIVFTKF